MKKIIKRQKSMQPACKPYCTTSFFYISLTSLTF
jgi:hypothetical protein